MISYLITDLCKSRQGLKKIVGMISDPKLNFTQTFPGRMFS
jgi:hypothetical protein